MVVDWNYFAGLIDVGWPTGVDIALSASPAGKAIATFRVPELGAFSVELTGNAYDDIIGIERGFDRLRPLSPSRAR